MVRRLFSWITCTIFLFFYQSDWKVQKSQPKYDTFKTWILFKVLCHTHVVITRGFLKLLSLRSCFVKVKAKLRANSEYIMVCHLTGLEIVAERAHYQPLNANCAWRKLLSPRHSPWQFTTIFFRAVPGWNSVPAWSCSKAAYKPVWPIPLLSVQWINSWWWTEELSETCRVSCQNKFVKLVHLFGFILKKFVTMHGHMNVKFITN